MDRKIDYIEPFDEINYNLLKYLSFQSPKLENQ